jgi:hypothetical protein
MHALVRILPNGEKFGTSFWLADGLAVDTFSDATQFDSIDIALHAAFDYAESTPESDFTVYVRSGDTLFTLSGETYRLPDLMPYPSLN